MLDHGLLFVFCDKPHSSLIVHELRALFTVEKLQETEISA